MKPKRREAVVQSDLFRSRLENIINLHHAWVKGSHTIDWNFLESKVSLLYASKGRPGLELDVGIAPIKNGLHL